MYTIRLHSSIAITADWILIFDFLRCKDMKKQYSKCELEIIEFETDDVITTSGDETDLIDPRKDSTI